MVSIRAGPYLSTSRTLSNRLKWPFLILGINLQKGRSTKLRNKIISVIYRITNAGIKA